MISSLQHKKRGVAEDSEDFTIRLRVQTPSQASKHKSADSAKSEKEKNRLMRALILSRGH
jgi:hypothetical protein